MSYGDNDPNRSEKMYSTAGLIANSAVTGVGMGLAVAAVSTSIPLILVGGGIGAAIGYSLTDDIPKN